LTPLEGVLEGDRGEAVDRLDAVRHLRVAAEPVGEHESDVADQPRAQRRHRLDHRVGRAALGHELLAELRAVRDGPEVIRRAAHDSVALASTVEARRLPRTSTDAEIEHVSLAVDDPPTIADGLRHLLTERGEAIALPVERREKITALAKGASRFVVGRIR